MESREKSQSQVRLEEISIDLQKSVNVLGTHSRFRNVDSRDKRNDLDYW